MAMACPPSASILSLQPSPGMVFHCDNMASSSEMTASTSSSRSSEMTASSSSTSSTSTYSFNQLREALYEDNKLDSYEEVGMGSQAFAHRCARGRSRSPIESAHSDTLLTRALASARSRSRSPEPCIRRHASTAGGRRLRKLNSDPFEVRLRPHGPPSTFNDFGLPNLPSRQWKSTKKHEARQARMMIAKKRGRLNYVIFNFIKWQVTIIYHDDTRFLLNRYLNTPYDYPISILFKCEELLT